MRSKRARAFILFLVLSYRQWQIFVGYPIPQWQSYNGCGGLACVPMWVYVCRPNRSLGGIACGATTHIFVVPYTWRQRCTKQFLMTLSFSLNLWQKHLDVNQVKIYTNAHSFLLNVTMKLQLEYKSSAISIRSVNGHVYSNRFYLNGPFFCNVILLIIMLSSVIDVKVFVDLLFYVYFINVHNKHMILSLY